MFSYLEPHNGPVVEGLDEFETVYAKDQPEYIPLRTLPGESGNSSISRWTPTPEQRKAIALGADILIEQTHFKRPLSPMRAMVTDGRGEYFPQWFAIQTRAPYLDQLPREGDPIIEAAPSATHEIPSSSQLSAEWRAAWRTVAERCRSVQVTCTRIITVLNELEQNEREVARLRSYVESLPADWNVDSSLETWFPFTAVHLKSMKRALDFQGGVREWFEDCFGAVDSGDVTLRKSRRVFRFVEEAIELGQSLNCTKQEVLQLVDYVYGRPPGEAHQEVGGVMSTLAMVCVFFGIDMRIAGEAELARIWKRIPEIREKDKGKFEGSPLPAECDATSKSALVAEPEPISRCIGYNAGCDGDLFGEAHKPHCPESVRPLNGHIEQSIPFVPIFGVNMSSIIDHSVDEKQASALNAENEGGK